MCSGNRLSCEGAVQSRGRSVEDARGMLSACVWLPSIRGRPVHSLICSPFLDPHVLLPGGWPGGLRPVLCPDRGTALLKPPLYMPPLTQMVTSRSFTVWVGLLVT